MEKQVYQTDVSLLFCIYFSLFIEYFFFLIQIKEGALL